MFLDTTLADAKSTSCTSQLAEALNGRMNNTPDQARSPSLELLNDFSFDYLNLTLSESAILGFDQALSESTMPREDLVEQSPESHPSHNTRQPPALFEAKTLTNKEAILSSTLAIAMLRGYPEMMRSCDTQPPFYHQHCYMVDGERKVPAPLVNMMSIAHMFHQRQENNRDFVWQSIDQQREQLLRQVRAL